MGELLEESVSRAIFDAIVPVLNRIHHDSRTTTINTPLGTMMVHPDTKKGVCLHCGREYAGTGYGKQADGGITLQRVYGIGEKVIGFFTRKVPDNLGQFYHFSENCVKDYERAKKRAKEKLR